MRNLTVFLAVVILLGIASAQVPCGHSTHAPPRSVGRDAFMQGALSYNPMAYDRGFKPDTTYVALITDDGWAGMTYDSCLYYCQQDGFKFGFGVPRDAVGMDGNHLTAAQIQTLFNTYGCEILNHFTINASPAQNDFLSHLGDNHLPHTVEDTYRYFVDTLGVGIPGVLPLTMGANYPAGDVSAYAKSYVARQHLYASGTLGSIKNHYENWGAGTDTLLAVGSGTNWLRWNGSMLHAFCDSIETGMSGKHVRVKSHSLLLPGSVPDQFNIPASATMGPSPYAGGGTVDELQYAKILVKYAIQNGAAVTFYFHRWDSVYTGGDPSDRWLGDFCKWLKTQRDSGFIKVTNHWDIVRDYLMRPVASDHNLFPDPSCEKPLGLGGRAVGWMQGYYSSHTAANKFHPRRVTGSGLGFDDDDCLTVRSAGAGSQMFFARVLPPDCIWEFSFKAKPYDITATTTGDSLSVIAYTSLRIPQWTLAEMGINTNFNPQSYNNNVTLISMIPEMSNCGNQYRVHDAAGSYRNQTWTETRHDNDGANNYGGHKLVERWMQHDTKTWKTYYVRGVTPGSPTLGLFGIRFIGAPTAWTYGSADAGLAIDNVCLVVRRRMGDKPVRW